MEMACHTLCGVHVIRATERGRGQLPPFSPLGVCKRRLAISCGLSCGLSRAGRDRRECECRRAGCQPLISSRGGKERGGRARARGWRQWRAWWQRSGHRSHEGTATAIVDATTFGRHTGEASRSSGLIHPTTRTIGRLIRGRPGQSWRHVTAEQ